MKIDKLICDFCEGEIKVADKYLKVSLSDHVYDLHSGKRTKEFHVCSKCKSKIQDRVCFVFSDLYGKQHYPEQAKKAKT